MAEQVEETTNVIASDSEAIQSDETSGLLRHSVPRNDKGKFSDLRLRIITGVAFAGIAGGMLWLGGWFWYGFIALCAAQMFREWHGLTKMRSLRFRLLGLPYILLPSAALIALYTSQNHQPLIIVWLVATVAATDIGAYFSGRIIGGAKLAPRLSPKKTWAGLVGGMIAAASTLLLLGYAEFGGITWDTLWIGVLTAVISQAGDIFESSLKRAAGVKDAGNILPGHGGLLDRVDGLLFAAPLWMVLVWWMD